MGNRSCTLVVQTEKKTYFAGETVNGRVFLSVNDQNGVVAQTLNIHFSGIERAVVCYTEEREENDRRVNEDFCESNEYEMFNFDVPINTPVGSLFLPGQYEFPFQFIVPQNLPSSMFCRYGQSKCEIRYEMKAYLSKSDRNSFVNPFNANTISSKPHILTLFGGNSSAIPSYLNAPLHFPGHSHRMRCCCCCLMKGQMNLSATVDSGVFVPNEIRNISFELKNNSRVRVKNVTVEVIERVHWKPRFHQEATNFTLVKHMIDGSTCENWMTWEERLEEYVTLSATSARSNDPTQLVSLRIPHSSRDTYTGRLIQVEHFVRVKVVTDGCCITNPETTVDILISRTPQMFTSNDGPGAPLPSAPFMDESEIVVEATALPPGWSPETSDLVTIPVANVISVSDAGQSQYSSPPIVPVASPEQGQDQYPSAPVVPSAPPMDK